MLNLSLAGSLGRDAEYKESQSGKGRCQFSVAVNVGFGEKKVTHWIDVTRWGDSSRGLALSARREINSLDERASMSAASWGNAAGMPRSS